MMEKSIRLARALLLFCISIFGIQKTYAQNPVADSLLTRFNDFRSKTFTEKIFLHTDRSSYLTGEDIWFTIYHVDASFHKPIAWSKVLYVELIGMDGKPVLQGKFPLGDALTTGSLYLPASLSSGTYELVAYTSWMKNFASESFFHQSIKVINPFVELPKEVDQGPDYDVQFFPEGGNLITGLENTVGFRVVGRDGKGVNFKGAILNQENDTVVRFSPLKFGLGRFNFTPEQNQAYKAIIVDSKKKSSALALPVIVQEGFVMQVVELNTKIKVTVRVSDKNEQSVYLLIHARLTEPQIEQVLLKDGEGILMIDKKKTATGVSHLTVFNDQLIPVCERLWFKKPERNLQFDVKLNEVAFSTRQKAELSIVAQAVNAADPLSNVSVVVYKHDSLDLPVDNIVSYLNLTSELKGQVEHAEYYFSDESIELSAATNNLMLTHGWRKINWKDVLERRYRLKYSPELNGHLISGKITEKTSGIPVHRVATYLTFADLPVNVYISRSDSLGRFLFETQPGIGTKNLIIQPEGKTTEYQLELDDPYYTGNASQHNLKFALSRSMKTALEQRSIHVQVNSLFHPYSKTKRAIGNEQPFYGKADEKYVLDDYTRFPTLEEVMREYVPGVKVNKVRGNFQLKNVDMVNKQPFREDPLVLVDGVPVFDINMLMAIDPLKIQKLDVVTKRYYLQAASFDGIVSLTSYKNDLGGFQPPASALLTSYSCFEDHREFFTPVYQTEKQSKSSAPDVRYVLYRSPDNLTASGNTLNLSFYTSDISGQFNVIVQGITKTGLPGYFMTTFEVK